MKGPVKKNFVPARQGRVISGLLQAVPDVRGTDGLPSQGTDCLPAGSSVTADV